MLGWRKSLIVGGLVCSHALVCVFAERVLREEIDHYSQYVMSYTQNRSLLGKGGKAWLLQLSDNLRRGKNVHVAIGQTWRLD